MKQRIYIDTSIVGGFFDEEFEAATKGLFKRLEEGEIVFVISDLLDLELIEAPERVREILYNYSSNLEDCRHIALATINRVDILSSWNFKHIVNLDRIKGYNSVNLRLGYQILEIRSPKDLIRYEND